MKPTPTTVFGNRHVAPEAKVVAMPVVEVETFPVELPADEAAMSTKALDHTLGNPELPIANFREQIVEAVDASQVVVLTAETGAGKSTQVPQFLAEAGYDVVMTQPRRVAARSVSARIADEVVAAKGEAYRSLVGYKISGEGNASSENRITTVTEGLQVVHELHGRSIGKGTVLVLDEAHEWSEDMEFLVAWTKKQMVEDPDFKVVIMSATMEAGPLAHYFADNGSREVPVIEVPGRTFPVEKHEQIVQQSEVYREAAKKAAALAEAGKTTLVFAPGKAEISQVIAHLASEKLLGVEILPLHGQQEKEEQQKVFRPQSGTRIIVATNVAQTSVTIPGIDVVVDTGVERRKIVRNGVESLSLHPISKADCLQRAGRAGRTKAGEYYLVSTTGFEDREAYSTPEILRTRLDSMTLRLARAGFDMSLLEFYNVERQGEEVKQQFAKEISSAKQRLEKLGALTENGEITKIGRQMERMPIESHYARMMIEARKYGKEVQLQLAASLAAQEAGGVTFNGRGGAQRWRRLTSGDTSSDVITQLEVLIGAQKLPYKQRMEYDVMGKNFSKAQEVFRQLRKVEGLSDQDLTSPTKGQRAQLVKCIVSGMVDNLYIREWGGKYHNSEAGTRELSKRSVVRDAAMVVGTPFNLEVQTRRGGTTTLQLIESATEVPSVEVLRDVAPQLFVEKSTGYAIVGGVAMEQREAYFNGTSTGQTTQVEAQPSPELHEFVVRQVQGMYTQSVLNLADLPAKVGELQQRTVEQLPEVTSDHIRQILAHEIPFGTTSLEEALRYVPAISVQEVVGQERIEAILAASPETWQGVTLDYNHGAARLAYSVGQDAIMALDPESMVLPDGREVRAYDGSSIAQYQDYIAAQHRAVAELKARAHAEKVQRATVDLDRGDPRELVVERYGEHATDEALAEIARSGEYRQEFDRLASECEAVARETVSIAVDDAMPWELQDKVYGVRGRAYQVGKQVKFTLDRLLNNSIRLAGTDIADFRVAIDELRSEAKSVGEQVAAWHRAEQERVEQPVSAAALEALTSHFNR